MGAILGYGLILMVVEIAIWIGIAQFTSGWWVFLWFVGAFFVGSALIRNGMQNLNPMAQQMKQGGFIQPHTRPPDSVMTKSMAFVAAGILLAIPGLLTDVLALLLMLPPVQIKLKDFGEKYMHNNQQKMMDMMMKRMQDAGMDASQFNQQFGGGGGNPFGEQSPFGKGNPFGNAGKYGGFGQTVDGSAKEIKDAKKITHAANDD